MKNTILLIFSLFIVSMSFAGSPNWSINRNDFANSMTITGRVKVAGNFTDDINDTLAVFVNGELRGVAAPTYVSALDEYYVFLLISSNVSSNEALEFKYYDASADEILDIVNTHSFYVDESEGTVSNPFIFLDVDGGNDILTYSFDGINAYATIDPAIHEVSLEIADGIDLSSVISTFTLSDGARGEINTIKQISGETVNNFSDTVYYQIYSAAGIQQEWKVYTTAPDESTSIKEREIHAFSLYPNPCVDVLTISLDEHIDGNVNIEIVDIQGRKINYHILSEDSKTINVEQLPAGVYQVIVSNDYILSNKTFIKS